MKRSVPPSRRQVQPGPPATLGPLPWIFDSVADSTVAEFDRRVVGRGRGTSDVELGDHSSTEHRASNSVQ